MNSKQKQFLPHSIQQVAILELMYYFYVFEVQVDLLFNPEFRGCLGIMEWSKTESGWNFLILFFLIITCALVLRNEAKRLAWIVKYGSLLSLFILNLGQGWLFVLPLGLLIYLYHPNVLREFEVNQPKRKTYILFAILLFIGFSIGTFNFQLSDFVINSQGTWAAYNY